MLNVLSGLILMASISTSAVGQSNLVVNGGFTANTSGWIMTNISGTGYVPSGGNPPGCIYLSNMSTSLAATVSQQINGLVPGTIYVAAGEYRWGGKNFASNSFAVELGGHPLLLAPTPPDYTWHSFTAAFQATATNALLSISALDGAENPYYVDNIVLQTVPSITIRSGDSNAVLSWPTNGLHFGLQFATNLSVGTWIDITNAPAISGTNYSVTVGSSQLSQFFRLKR